MTFKTFTVACAATAIIAVPTQSTALDKGDFAAGILAGVVGSAVVRNVNKQQRRNRTVETERVIETPRRTVAPQQQVVRPSIPSTSEGFQLQTALNYFGYDAGSVDGQVGPGTRNAVSRYQSSLGYVADGNIDPQERSTLLGAYDWATNGGVATSGGLGGQALLRDYQQRLASNTLYANQQTTASAGATSLPSFQTAPQNVSLAAHCEAVNRTTSSNGGYTTSRNLVDANFALNEQFCLARSSAISEGDKLAATVQGLSQDEVQAQCSAFGSALKDYIVYLSQDPASVVVQDVRNFVGGSGMSPVQLTTTAEICLGVGYKTDDLDVAIGSALILVAENQSAYAELLGHHLSQGFGTAKRPDLAVDWYDVSMNAINNGATPVFASGSPDRNRLIRNAVAQLPRSGAASNAAIQPASGTALPAFNVNK